MNMLLLILNLHQTTTIGVIALAIEGVLLILNLHQTTTYIVHYAYYKAFSHTPFV